MKLNALLKVTAIIGILTVSFSVAYYFVIFLPQKAKEKRVYEQGIREENLTKLDVCLKEVDRFVAQWNNKEASAEERDYIRSTAKQAQDTCFKRFPIK